jgi:hypothetical protein
MPAAEAALGDYGWFPDGPNSMKYKEFAFLVTLSTGMAVLTCCGLDYASGVFRGTLMEYPHSPEFQLSARAAVPAGLAISAVCALLILGFRLQFRWWHAVVLPLPLAGLFGLGIWYLMDR